MNGFRGIQLQSADQRRRPAAVSKARVMSGRHHCASLRTCRRSSSRRRRCCPCRRRLCCRHPVLDELRHERVNADGLRDDALHLRVGGCRGRHELGDVVLRGAGRRRRVTGEAGQPTLGSGAPTHGWGAAVAPASNHSLLPHPTQTHFAPHLHVPSPGEEVGRHDDAARARRHAPPHCLLYRWLSQFHVCHLHQGAGRHAPADQRPGGGRGRGREAGGVAVSRDGSGVGAGSEDGRLHRGAWARTALGRALNTATDTEGSAWLPPRRGETQRRAAAAGPDASGAPMPPLPAGCGGPAAAACEPAALWLPSGTTR